jgi:hypothetical protein
MRSDTADGTLEFEHELSALLGKVAVKALEPLRPRQSGPRSE